MKASELLWGVGAFAAAGLLFMFWRRDPAGAAPGAAGGAQSWYGQAAQQAGISDAAIRENWRQLQDGVFRTQPDFWV